MLNMLCNKYNNYNNDNNITIYYYFTARPAGEDLFRIGEF